MNVHDLTSLRLRRTTLLIFLFFAATSLVQADLASGPATLALDSDGTITLSSEGEETDFSADGAVASAGEDVRLSVYPRYYENNTSVGKGHYKPLDRSVFKDPPTGWNSWYIYFAAIDENNIHSNIDWLGENLRQFGLTYAVLDDGWQTASRGFFQYANSAYKQRDRERMDELAEESGSWAEWNEKFPSGGKAVADYIKSRGLTPGLWLCPFATDENELTEAHPEWWVRDEEGWIVPTFKARYTIDATNPEVLREWLKPTIRRMVEDWGFEYLKMDGMTHVTKAYKDHEARLYANRKEDVEDMGWVEAYREGHKAIREAAGQDTFTLSCWGTAWQGVGLTDSSRTGTDAGVGQSDIIDVRIERPFGA